MDMHPHRTLAAVVAAVSSCLLVAPTRLAAEPTAAPPAAPEGKAASPAVVGQPAPEFTLSDVDGKRWSLADLRGQKVVLEWFNPDCPFVRYAHSKGPLKEMGNRLAGPDLVWLAINSGAPGRQGHGLELNRQRRTEYGMTYPLLVDENGVVGRRYGAHTTPEMVLIDADGTLVYRGAIDNAPLGDHEGASQVNYLENALQSLAAGEPVHPSETRPYGCSVKYAVPTR